MRIGRTRKTRRALVLGCGPAGLFATHALRTLGWEVEIWSRARPSQMYGAQYLHGPVPGLSEDEPTRVNVRLEGSWEESTRKVYGPTATPAGSFEEYLKTRGYAWDIRAAYAKAWGRYGSLVQDLYIQDAEVLESMLGGKGTHTGFNLIINSIPRNRLCLRTEQHSFTSLEFWAAGDAPDRDIWCPISCPPDTVVLNGTSDRAWYRISNVFGHTTAEWPIDRKPPIEAVARVNRPLATNCDCWSGMIHVGRYGAWAPGYLSHTSYADAIAAAARVR